MSVLSRTPINIIASSAMGLLAICMRIASVPQFNRISRRAQVRPFTPADLPMMRVIYKGQLTWHNGWFYPQQRLVGKNSRPLVQDHGL